MKRYTDDERHSGCCYDCGLPMKDKAWEDWIGEEHVAAEFMGDMCHWPIAGWPAWIIIDAVDMPLLLIRSAHGGEQMWVNAAIIKRVWGK